MFKPVSPKVDLPKLEEEIIQFWKENKIFEKSLEKASPKGNWTFLDGPPFVTGLPHYGHLLTSIAKDLFPRFKTMQGYHVRRVWGWDGHGLPVENKVENKLNIKRKKDIEEVVGVKKFIEECKAYVTEISGEWEWYVDHVARWVDFKNAYKTWDMPYMESVMWVFKEMYEKDLIYKGLKVSLYCPHCATPISNFEVAMDADNYKDVTDFATTYKYELEAQSAKFKTQNNSSKLKTYILAWSTTPWNKIVTPALAVNPKLTYVLVQQGSEQYILAKSTIKNLRNDPKYEIVDEFKGEMLIGKKFIPHYDYYKIEVGKKAFEIIGGDFVTADEGTGVVTIAAYGEEDLKASLENNIHIEMHIDEEGHVKKDVPLFGGMYYAKANKAVNDDLEKRGLIYRDEQLPHNVPHCWRCATRLYYAPITAWYVNVQKVKNDMKKTNEDINWIPNHFQHGRFLKSLEHAPDWNISRNRYWGSPVPVWECECGERFVPGSIKELEIRSGRKITDLHKPEIDEVTVECAKCKKKVQRVPEVLDSWIEAGSASFGERHYPFDPSTGSEQDKSLKDFYPPDFIVEYTGQIRAWFYVLDVISNALYNTAAFKNVLVNGVILGTDGRKMSKNFKNYPDPKEMLQKYGGDALRLYLMSSPVVQGEDTSISEEQYREQVRGTLLLLWNVYNFFVSNANVDKYGNSKRKAQSAKQQLKTQNSKNVLDRWILLLLNNLTKDVTESLDSYDTVNAIAKLEVFVAKLSTWYIRRSRDRVGPSADDQKDKEAFYQTSYYVLVTLCKLLAPITPFITEEMYRNLTGEESVHLAEWPKESSEFRVQSSELLESMAFAQIIAGTGHAARKGEGIVVKQPLRSMTIVVDKISRKLDTEFEKLILDELNVKQIIWKEDEKEVKKTQQLAQVPKGYKIADDFFIILDTTLTEELITERKVREIIRAIQEERKKLGTALDEKVDVMLSSWPKDFENEIKKKALVRLLSRGNTFKVTRV